MSVTIRPATAGDSSITVDIVRSVYDEFSFSWDEADYHADLYDLKAGYFDKGHILDR